jgi:ABC-type sugar transport system permease subunit/ABC-type glycerol-3-phosphate transport system substrate-binding protein
MMRNKLIVCLLLTLCFGLSLAAQSNSPRSGKRVLLKVAVPMPGRPGREIYDLFLKQNPDIEFARTGGITLEGAASGAGFFMAMAGGTAPDLFKAPLEAIDTFYTQGFLYPLDKIAGKNAPLFKSIRRFVKPIVIKGNHVYAMPIYYKAHSMAFRKDIFAKHNLPLHSPENWDELFNFALKIHNPEKGIVGYAIYGGAWLFSHVLWEAGGEYMTYGIVNSQTGEFKPLKPGEKPLKPKEKGMRLTIRSRFQGKPGQMAVNLYRRLLFCKWARDGAGGKMVFRDLDINSGKFIWKQTVKSPLTGQIFKLNNDRQMVSDGKKQYKLYTGVAITVSGRNIVKDVFNRFKRGKLGMMILAAGGGRDGVMPDYNPAVVGLGMMPIGPSGKIITLSNAHSWCVNSQIKPERREAAWRFIKFMCSTEVQKLKVQMMVERGLASYVLPQYLKLAGYSQYIDDVPKDWVKANKILEKYARAVPNEPGWQMVASQIREMLEYLTMQEKVDVAEVLKKRAKYCDTIYSAAMGETKAQKLSSPVKIVILLVLLLLLAGMAVVIFHYSRSIMKSQKDAVETLPGSKNKFSKIVIPLLFMAPALSVVLCFHYLPLVRGSIMAFYDYKIIGESIFVGIDNFVDALLSPAFWWSMYITVKYMLISLAIGFALPIIVALLLDEIPFGKYFFRTIYYLPAITSGLIIMLMWKEFYDPTAAGMLNKLFAYFGLGPFSFLKDPDIALVCVVIPGAWAAAGPGSILYLAALKCIPTELYEASAVDGAKWYHKIFYITLPTLFPLILINFIGAFLGAMQGMGNILVMTGGGPDRQTQVIGLEIFYNAYVYLKFGYAISLAWILGAVLLGATAVKMQIMKKVDFRSAENN